MQTYYIILFLCVHFRFAFLLYGLLAAAAAVAPQMHQIQMAWLPLPIANTLKMEIENNNLATTRKTLNLV
jgi:hypothetical protein